MRSVLVLGAGLVAAGSLVAAPALASAAAPADGNRGVASTSGSTGSTGSTASTGSGSGDITLPERSVLAERVTRFCHRVPDLSERLTAAQKRLAGDADVVGSLDWLERRVAAADEDDLPRVTRRLERRLERRTERAARLPERLEALQKARSECASLGLGTGG